MVQTQQEQARTARQGEGSVGSHMVGHEDLRCRSTHGNILVTIHQQVQTIQYGSVVQTWLNSRDDHMSYWLSYGGQSLQKSG